MHTESLLKIPLLIGNSFGKFVTYSPPTARPDTEARKQYGQDERRMRYENAVGGLNRLRARRVLGYSMDAIEAYLILVQIYPQFSPVALFPILRGYAPESYQCATRLHFSPSFVAGSFLQWSGAGLRWLCFRTLGRHFTFQPAILPNHQLITSGPYSIVRHPGYLGSFVFHAGLAICQFGEGTWMRECILPQSLATWRDWCILVVVTVTWLVYNGAVLVMLWSRMAMEDRILKKNFEKEWEAWAQKTPYKVLPGIY